MREIEAKEMLDRAVALGVALASTLATVLFFWRAPGGGGTDAFLNSDLLYLPAFFDDLARGGRFTDWKLTPSPYLFPDMALFAPLWLISSSSHVLPWLIAATQGLLWTPAVMSLSTREARASGEFVSWVPAALSLQFGLALYRSTASAAFGPFLVLTSHAGHALLGGLLLGLLRAATGFRFATALLLMLAGALSDPFFVLGFLAALGMNAFTERQPVRAKVAATGLVLIAAATGLAVRSLLPLPPQQTGLLNWNRTLESFAILARTSHEPRGQLALVFWFVAALVALGAWRLGRGQRALVTWLMVGIFSVVGAVAIGAPTAFPDSRYLTAHTLALGSFAAISIARLLPTPRLWLLIGVIALADSARVAVESRTNIANLGVTQNKFVECFEKFRAEAPKPVSRCVAGYWAAKPISLYSAPRVVALQVKPDGTPDWFVSTKRHFASKEAIDCAAFPANEVGIFLSRYGPPSFRKDCDGVVVLGYFGEDMIRLNAALQPVLAQPAVPSPFF